MTNNELNLSPNNNLAENLAQADIIKQNMTELLRQLETKATGKPVENIGSWRHHTSDWSALNPVQKPASN